MKNLQVCMTGYTVAGMHVTHVYTQDAQTTSTSLHVYVYGITVYKYKI